MDYFLCYKDDQIGRITFNHLGLGWMSTSMVATPAYSQHREFIAALNQAYKLPANSEELKTELRRLRKLYGPDITVPDSWSIRDENNQLVQRMATVPKISEYPDRLTASWKKKG